MIRDTVIHPHTGEKLGAIRLGVYLQSKTRRWADDEIPELQTPIGGHVITNGDDRWEVVTIHHGRPYYHIINAEELDWDCYDGLVNAKYIRGAIKTVTRYITDRGNLAPRALDALNALNRALEVR